MQSSLNNLTALAKKGPTFSREFDALVRAIGECKSKAEEDSIISKEVEILKPRLKDPKMDKRWLKELLIRLIYVEMLGHDASWAHVKALQACSETGLITKKVRSHCAEHGPARLSMGCVRGAPLQLCLHHIELTETVSIGRPWMCRTNRLPQATCLWKRPFCCRWPIWLPPYSWTTRVTPLFWW